jgi:hypothetical protein
VRRVFHYPQVLDIPADEDFQFCHESGTVCALFPVECDWSAMQAATIVMNLLSTNTASPQNISGNKPGPGVPSFSQAFSDRVSDAPPAENSVPPSTVPEKSLPLATPSIQLSRGIARKNDGHTAMKESQTSQTELGAIAPAGGIPPIASLNPAVQNANPKPQQVKPQKDAGPQTQRTSTLSVTTNAAGSAATPATPGAAEGIANALARAVTGSNADSAIADDAGSVALNLAQSFGGGVAERAGQTVATPIVAALPQASPLAQTAALVAVEKANMVAGQSGPPDASAQSIPNAPDAAAPEGITCESLVALPELLVSRGASGDGASSQRTAPPLSLQVPNETTAPQIPMLPSKPANAPKNANSLPVPRLEPFPSPQPSVPIRISLPPAADSSQQSDTIAAKPITQTHTVEEKTVVGAENSVTKANLAAAGGTPTILTKTAEQGSAGQNGNFQDAKQYKEPNAPAANSASCENQNLGETTADVDPKTTTAAQSISGSPEKAVPTLAVARTANPNASADVVPIQTSISPNPAVSEHGPGQPSAKDPTIDDSPRDTSPGALQNPNIPDLHPTQGISNAQISGNTAQSEIHISLRGDKLGAVELHAQVTGEQVGAAIVVEKKDAHAALAVELPALQQALTDKNLRVEHIWLTQGSLDATAGDSGNASGQQPRGNAGKNFAAAQREEAPSPFAAGVTMTDRIFDDGGHLSVRA